MAAIPRNIKFTKMHGLGNDFVVIDAISQSIDVNTLAISTLSHRQLGIGFDQLLLIGKSQLADFSCRFFNADGSEAEQCGNGARAVARFLHENHFLKKNQLRLETKAGVFEIFIHDYDHIEVNMGKPEFFNSPLQHFITLSMGNPHAILVVPSVNDYPVSTEGEKIATHPVFPKGINVGFMQIVDKQQIRLRTYERGVGETCACGTNACAAVVAGIINHLLDRDVTVELHYGNLFINWKDEQSPVMMTGPTTKVFTGEILLN